MYEEFIHFQCQMNITKKVNKIITNATDNLSP